jgi:hypothetical protein
MTTCACGCKTEIAANRRFVHGHNVQGLIRADKRKPVWCACGCGGLVAETAREANRRKYLDEHRPAITRTPEQKAFVGNLHRTRVHRRWTEEERRKHSTLLRLRSKRGEASHSWRGKGGVDPSKAIRRTLEYRDWRKAVYQRDDWTCQACWKRGGHLHPHHIRPMSTNPELTYVVSNGVTLCRKCHTDLHRSFRPWQSKA